MAKKKKKFEVEFDMVSDRKLPDYIAWEEEEVMYELAKFFRQKIDNGHYRVTMAEIVKQFGHTPEPHMYNQIFEIAESLSDPDTGIMYKGNYYHPINNTIH
jgi:glutathionyl-hydroquinone reductase